MKAAHRKPFAFVLALVLASSLLSTYAAASENQVITKKEFKTLLKTAKEPVEHREIVEYYRQEAARLTASAKEHEELAEVYAKNPPFPAIRLGFLCLVSRRSAGWMQAAYRFSL